MIDKSKLWGEESWPNIREKRSWEMGQFLFQCTASDRPANFYVLSSHCGEYNNEPIIADQN
jgi:hypothetical protein